MSVCLNDAVNQPNGVLAQIQEGTSYGYPAAEQARIRLTPDEARQFAQMLLANADRVEAPLAGLANGTVG